MTEVLPYRAIINQHQEHKQTIWDAQCVDRETLQGFLAHKEPPPPWEDPTEALCLGTWRDPRGVVFLVSEVPLYPNHPPTSLNPPGPQHQMEKGLSIRPQSSRYSTCKRVKARF